MRWAALVFALVGCPSTQPEVEHPPTPAPPRDAAVATTPQPVPDAGDDEDPPPDYSYRFEWQQLRDANEVFRKGTAAEDDDCDIRHLHFRPSLHCPGPHEVAGLALRTGSGRTNGTAGILIDRGARDMITTDWMVALLDDAGHPITPWAPIYKLRDEDQSYADVQTTPWIAAHHLHVGMRVDVNVLDNNYRREHRY